MLSFAMELCVSPQPRAIVKLRKYGTENCSMREEPPGGCAEQLKLLETEIHLVPYLTHSAKALIS